MTTRHSYFAALLACVAVVPAQLWAQVSTSAATQALPVPLASHPQGQAMMAQAVQKAALLDVTFTFLNKTYENDTYATDPLGNRYRTGCYRFAASSGFRFTMDAPQFVLNNQGLTITQNIARIHADGLVAKAQVLLCQEIALGVGLRLSDVKVTYRARPTLSFNQANGACTLNWNPDGSAFKVEVGDLNILGVQNDIDQLAKKAVNEAFDLAFNTFYGSSMRGELLKITASVCGQPRRR